MKDSFEKVSRKKSKKNTEINNIALFVQGILLAAIIILMIFSIFLNELFVISKLLLGILLLIMAYNNQKIFKRKKFTIVYCAIGLYMIIASVIELL